MIGVTLTVVAIVACSIMIIIVIKLSDEPIYKMDEDIDNADQWYGHSFVYD